jgi:hypothetical protein
MVISLLQEPQYSVITVTVHILKMFEQQEQKVNT